MSENLSIEEIIKRAEQIKAEAERQLKDAERALDEQAKAAMEKVNVDAKKVRESVEEIVEKEDDIKEFTSSSNSHDKTQNVKLGSFKNKFKLNNQQEQDDDEDIKIAPNFAGAVHIDEDESDDDMKIAPEVGKAKNKVSSNTRIMSFGKNKKDEEPNKPVILSTNEQSSDNSDLEPIPTIVAHDNIKNAFDKNRDNDYDDDMSMQMRFDGFDDAVESVPTIDEALAEQILEQRRQEKVGKFRLFGPDETDEELGDRSVVKDDFENADKSDDFLNSLNARKASIGTKLIATLVLGVPLVLLWVIKDKSFCPAFLSNHIVYYVLALVFLVAAIAVNFNIIIHGFNFKKGINFDFSVSILSVLTLAHTIALLLNESLCMDDGVMLGSVACFGLFMSQLGKHQMMVRIIDNFEFISANEDRFTVENIANNVDVEILSRGIVEVEDPIVKHSVKTDLPTNFMEISCKNEPADKIAKTLSPAILGLSALLLLVVGLLDNFNTAINCALSALATATPIASLFITNDMMFDISASLDKYGSRVCGYEGAVMAGTSDAMVMEAADLFGKRGCDLHGIKTFNGEKVDEAIIQTAAVIIQTKSPLAHVFDDVIIGKQSILPKVEGVTYEEQMGTSAWIYKRKVLVGTRDLLVRHDVQVPKKSFEEKYTRKGRKALYLAVGGKAVAMFVVSYSADPDLKRELKKLEKSGISIIVKSSDPYINEQSLNELFDLPEGYIHVMNSSSARVFDKYSNMTVEKSPSYIVHDGSALGFVSAMRGAGVAISSKNVISFLVSFGSALGFAIIALLSLIRGYSQISIISIMGFQIIWNLFIFIIGKFRRGSI